MIFKVGLYGLGRGEGYGIEGVWVMIIITVRSKLQCPPIVQWDDYSSQQYIIYFINNLVVEELKAS